ncbi:TonB-dependent receptor [Sphingomonas sp.]|uniref:TonB-dependent receptor n=1 Tax=Sphingomonas sp. TaxID=28214 RepID=UPI0025E0839F|nr:TonB-dependent receptor [Sphingomonas sp.]
MIRTLAAALATGSCLVALATPAAAQTRDFNVPAGSLRTALDTFARQSGRQVIYRGDEVRSARSPGVRGARTAEEALEALVAGTGFTIRKDSSGAFAVVRVGNAPAADSITSSEEAGGRPSDHSEIIVTGTNIRGIAPVGAPLTTYNRKDIEKTGASDVPQFFRTVPQLFSNIDASTTTTNLDAGSGAGNSYGGASANIHGLGYGATLSLVNGHRLAPAGTGGLFADISVIPLSALERVEILPDGASSVYGADAVAGVVNFVTRKDYSGVELNSRIAVPTRGGGRELFGSVAAGANWSSGHVFASAQIQDANAITVSQRSFILTDAPAGVLDGYNLEPSTRQISTYAIIEQKVSNNLRLSGDVLFSRRKFQYFVPTDTFNDESNTGNATQLGISASLTYDDGGPWSAILEGSYSRNDQKTLRSIPSFDFTAPFDAKTYSKSLDGRIQGELFDINGKSAKFSGGASLRKESLSVDNGSTIKLIDRNVWSGYGELYLPLLYGSGLVELSASGRYDHYTAFGGAFSPRLALNWRPTSALVIRGSFGRSFRAPDLVRISPVTYVETSALDLPLASSPTGYGTLLTESLGSNPDLGPERSRSINFGATWKPFRRTSLSITYFNVLFRDRIDYPRRSKGTIDTFTDPAISFFLDRNPSAAEVMRILSEAPLANNTGLLTGITHPVTPDNVAAIYRSYPQNHAITQNSGLDFSATQNFTLGAWAIDSAFTGTYLIKNRTQPGPNTPFTDFLNITFNPPRFRARASVDATHNRVSVGTAANFINSYTNNLTAPVSRVHSWLTVDLNARYAFGRRDNDSERWAISLNVVNLFDRRPPVVSGEYGRFGVAFDYDSANASARGRVVSAQLQAKF